MKLVLPNEVQRWIICLEKCLKGLEVVGVAWDRVDKFGSSQWAVGHLQSVVPVPFWEELGSGGFPAL